MYARPYYLQPASSLQSMSPNYRSVTYRREGMYKGMGQTVNVDPSSLPTVGVSNDPLMNLPLTGPMATAYGSTYGQAALQPGAGWMVPSGFYQTAPGAGSGTGTTPNMWVWIIGGGLLLVILLGGRGRR